MNSNENCESCILQVHFMAMKILKKVIVGLEEQELGNIFETLFRMRHLSKGKRND